MSTDLGAGLRGGGGTPADSTDPTIVDRVVNRSLVDYSINKKTTDQKALSPLELTNAVAVKETDQYIILSVGTEFLFCSPYVGGEEHDSLVQVSIPVSLRLSFWDGRVSGDWTYSLSSYGTRIKVNSISGAVIEEYLAPAYEAGEIIQAANTNTADGNISLLVDHNDGGRSWRPFTDRRMLVTAVSDDTLTCSAIEDPTQFYQVAKPHALRRTPWDNVGTIGGVSYVYSGSENRTASQSGEDDEDQLVIPPYILGQTEILVAQSVTPLAAGSEVTYLQDLNADARAWALVPA